MTKKYNQRKSGKKDLQFYWFQMPVAQETLYKIDFLRGMIKANKVKRHFLHEESK